MTLEQLKEADKYGLTLWTKLELTPELGVETSCRKYIGSVIVIL